MVPKCGFSRSKGAFACLVLNNFSDCIQKRRAAGEPAILVKGPRSWTYLLTDSLALNSSKLKWHQGHLGWGRTELSGFRAMAEGVASS